MIGFFDSGFGGLTVLRRVVETLPQYDYLYLGDNARAPYGSRSQEVVYEFTREAVEYLFRRGCPLIIIACNTSSAKALRRIQQEYLPVSYPDRRVLGVVRPLVEEVADRGTFHRVGLLATEGVVASEAYLREIEKARPLHPRVSESLPASRAHHRGGGAGLGRGRNDRPPLSRGTHGRGRLDRCAASGLHPLPHPL